MKKKHVVSQKDKNDWVSYAKKMDDVTSKENDHNINYTNLNKIRKLDLHGFSLQDANRKVKKFIIESYNYQYAKLLVVTGKGLRSKSYDNPYISEKMSILKYSVPEFIKNDEDLFEKISRISTADLRDGGEGAFYIFFKKVKKSIE